MKVLTSPLFLRMTLALFAAAFAFVMAIVLMRRIRRSFVQETVALGESTSSLENLPLQTYHAVIQELKQQKHELSAQQQSDRRRAKATESLSAAVLSNLSSGVLFFNPQGLVRQANQAAKAILGFASLVGMNAIEIFRDTPAFDAGGDASFATAAGAIRATLRDRIAVRRLQVEYMTPAMEQRVLEITVSPVPDADGSLLGAACLVTDVTTIAQIRRNQDLHGEISAEMALTLRGSLLTISGYAHQLAQNPDSKMSQQLAADIAAEATQLNRTIGGFLAEATATKAGQRH
jgi:PAS domain-containing protein